MSEKIKEWSFFLYANGNNELEPETWQSVVDIQRIAGLSNIYVAVQVSRETQETVSLLRSCMPSKDGWSGVRRYAFEDNTLKPLESLTGINMADPASLYNFLDWAISAFPAKRYMLSVSGHIYQFVGMCPDYSGNVPLMMGFPELSASIQSVFEAHDTNLDVLVLDTCYASTVEILYELGRCEQPRIKHLLTYIGKGPLEGLPYSGLLRLLDDAAQSATNHILETIVSRIAITHRLYGMIALTINHEMLVMIQHLFDRLANSYLLCKEAAGVQLTPQELLTVYRTDYPWSLYLKPLHRLLDAVVLATRRAGCEDTGILPIHVLSLKIPDEQRKKLYCRLSFANENHWSSLLCGYLPSILSKGAILEPLTIPKNILATFIYASNESLSPALQASVTEELIRLKGWVFI